VAFPFSMNRRAINAAESTRMPDFGSMNGRGRQGGEYIATKIIPHPAPRLRLEQHELSPSPTLHSAAPLTDGKRRRLLTLYQRLAFAGAWLGFATLDHSITDAAHCAGSRFQWHAGECLGVAEYVAELEAQHGVDSVPDAAALCWRELPL
jgi:hypothetical protein